MTKPLAVLIVEDSENDALLLVRGLEKAGYEISSRQVDTAAQMREALTHRAWDILISDYSMPQFNGLAALRVLQETGQDIPFIVVSGTMGEETAVAMMKAGANDYLTKGNLARLAPAIERELADAEVRRSRRKAEEELRESEDRYRDLVEHSHDLICTHDLQGRILTVNAAASRISGFSENELLNMNLSDFLAPEVRDQFEKYLVDVRSKGTASGFLIILTKKGEKRIWEYHNSLRLQNNSAPIVRGTAHDVTERRKAEAKYRSIFENSIEGIFQSTPEGRFLTANPALAHILGYESPEEMIQMIADMRTQLYVHTESLNELTHLLEQQDAVVGYQAQAYRKDGTKIWISEKIYAVRDKERKLLHYEGFIEDITQQRKAQEALSQSEERLRRIAENVSEVFWMSDPASTEIYYVSPAYEKVWGRTCQSLYERPTSFAEAIHPDDAQKAMQEIEKQSTGESYDHEYRIVRPDGSIRWIWDRSFPVPNENGQIDRIAGVAQDVTERKRAENESRESDRRFRDMLHNLELVAGMLDCDANITYCNDYLLRLTGWQREEIIGRNWFDIFAPAELANEMRSVYTTLLANKPSAWHYENEILTRSGSRKFIRWNNSVLRSSSGEVIGTASVGEDITEHKLLEAQLLQSQKLEAIGQLAGGVAHDFNNTLMAIGGYAELMLLELPEHHTQRKILSEILKSTGQGANLTRQLLAFSRRQVLSPKILDLNKSIVSMENMLRRLIGEDVNLVTLFGRELGFVCADPGQIEQVLMNLAVNARDAMPRGGTLTIQTENVCLNNEYAKQHLEVKAGHYVLLTVGDTGSGMSEEIISHVFEPFFTTKEEGKGTGLGLSTVYGIVKQSGGHITVGSRLAKGTVFKIYFPRQDANEVAFLSSQPVAADISGHGEVILLVDDNDSVRNALAQLLESKGYRVLPAGHGNEALELARRQAGPIHLLISDVVMPGMSGTELSRLLSKERLELKTLYMSGYAKDAIEKNGILDEGTAFMQKPATMRSLLAKIAELLAEAKP